MEVVVPSYAAWFDLQAIHEIEKRSLPEFFPDLPIPDDHPVTNLPKSPLTYKEYRDFMVHTYRLNPTEYLSVTTCRRHLTGDAGSILRVHSFLEQWGLINYLNGPPVVTSEASAKAKPRVLFETPRGMFNPASASGIAVANLSQNYSFPNNSDLTPAPKAQDAAPEIPRGRSYFCSTCTVLLGKNTGGRYHCLKDTSVNLCKSCFLEGRFPASLYSGDFVRLSQSDATASEEITWTDEEILLLLEGIEMHGGADSDWNKISEHVGSGKTKEQCIMQFLKLPIQDALVGGTVADEQVCFQSWGDNPLIGVVTFLASMVHPGVAAEAAKAAIKASTVLEQGPVTGASLEALAGTAMGVTAAKAKALADEEAKSLGQMLNLLLEMVLKKIDLKLKQFDEIERLLHEERREVEAQRNAVLLERIQLRKEASILAQKQIAGVATEESALQPQDVEMAKGGEGEYTAL